MQEEMGRALVLASLNCVDAVVIFDEETPVELIRSLRPNLLVKGGEYKPEQVVGADLVEGWGGKLLLVDMIPAGAPRKQYPAFAVKGKTAIPKPCS
jgi:bifunctional ADP-heptose synthase (sugar kinase/adenylyltransferase)